MHNALLIYFGVGLPLAGALMIGFAKSLLMDAIPKIDPEVNKTRTDIFSIRAAHVCFIAGIGLLVVWSLGITALGIIAGLRVL